MDPFVHLHVASSYSLRYGTATPATLVGRVGEYGMDALAVTDRDGLYGAVKHVRACAAAGIRPLVGTDLALPDGSRVTVLAKRGGWPSLTRLVTAAHLSSERGKPVVTRDMIAAHAAGLAVLLGPSSDVGRAAGQRSWDQAGDRLAAWRTIAEDLVIEVVDHFDAGERHTAARLLGLAADAGLPAVLTNAVRYLDPFDAPVAHVLDAARKLVPLHPRHIEQRTPHAFLKTGKEMLAVAERICGPDSAVVKRLFANARALADQCALDPKADLGIGTVNLPEVRGDPVEVLRRRCADGMVRRGLEYGRQAAERLADELEIIERKQLSAYFVAVAEVTDLIRALGIRCAVRGSGAGCFVTYLIGIGDVNPLHHGLLMERFLSDGRKGLPDIDVDVESARRLEAYQAIFDRYGEQRVACVAMMETYRARGALRDVGAALGLPPGEIDRVAKAFPHIRAAQIRAALRDLPELRSSGLDTAQLGIVFRLAERLDGLPRHIAMHPCGVLICDTTLRDRTPVERSLLGFPMSQFDKDDVEDIGLLKLDVLGVRMQSTLAYAVDEIERIEGERIDLDAIPRADAPTYQMISEARTLGCFQIESPGQRELVAKLEPRTIGDLIVDISLFRPGPVNSDMVTPYLEVRHGWRPSRYPHADLEEVLAETYGVVVYHEQVLKIMHRMTGCGLSDAEKARRLLEEPTKRDIVRDWFGELALKKGYDAATVWRVWEVLEAFGAFGFCKAHAAAFALPTYQSAWVKRHHPAAFFAGVLTHDPGMYPKRVIIDDARHFGVPVLPLDVNVSSADWRVERAPDGEYGVRVALREVKGISEAEVARIVAGQPYHSLTDFARRAHVSRPVVERIILVGGFDAMYGITAGGPRRRRRRITRRDLLAQVGALERAGVAGNGRRAGVMGGGRQIGGQLPLGFTEQVPAGELPELTVAETVDAELSVLGFDATRHVISFYDELLDGLGVVRAKDLLRCRSEAEVLVAGVKIATQTPAVRSGQRIIFATLDDSTGLSDLTFFESVQDTCAATLFSSWLLVARGVIRRTGTRALSLCALACWDLVRLDEIWRTQGLAAVREFMAQSERPGVSGRRFRHASGSRISPYSDITPADSGVREPPRQLWHASPGSSGGWADGGD